MLVSLYLKEQGINNRLLNSLDFMRLAPEEEPDMEYIGTKLHLLLAEHKSTNVFLTQGHLCRNAYNETCYLKQGGDDVSATLIGAALQAQEVCLWTDSKELHRCDPRFVKHPAMVKQLSFDEAEQLAYCGWTGFNPHCILPARENNIPIRLLCSMEPAEGGTLISNSQSGENIKPLPPETIFITLNSNRTERYAPICSSAKYSILLPNTTLPCACSPRPVLMYLLPSTTKSVYRIYSTNSHDMQPRW